MYCIQLLSEVKCQLKTTQTTINKSSNLDISNYSKGFAMGSYKKKCVPLKSTRFVVSMDKKFLV